MLQVTGETGQAVTKFEAGKCQLVGGDRGEPGKRDLQGAMMKQRDPQERKGEQNEIDRNAEEIKRLSCRGGGGVRCLALQ